MNKILGGVVALSLIFSFSPAFAKVDWPVKSADKITSANEMRIKIVEDATLWEIAIDPAILAEFDSLVAEAQTAYESGQYKKANSLAGEAKDLLDPIEESIEAAEEADEAIVI